MELRFEAGGTQKMDSMGGGRRPPDRMKHEAGNILSTGSHQINFLIFKKISELGLLQAVD